VSTALEHIDQKLERANEHVQELKLRVDAFLGETPNRTLTDYEPEAGKAFEDFQRNRIIPPIINVITGEAIHQIRSSLDHLVCALILRECGALTISTQFPIFLYRPVKPDELERYERQIKGINRSEVRDIIQSHQPYTRGDRRRGHWLGILKTLSNTDKHRSLIVHVTHVDRRLHTTVTVGGWTIDGVGPDDGTEPTSGPGPDGELVEIQNIKREMTTRVTFDVWGDTGQVISVDDGLARLRKGVADIVDELRPYLS
jgi:hypothetical protein